MTTRRTYDGPIFDVQAHAIKPDLRGGIANGIQRETGLQDETKDTILNDILVKLADDLEGQPRLSALGKENIQVITINTFFPPSLPAERLLAIVEDINVWMSTAVTKSDQLIGTASIPPAPVLARAGRTPDGIPYNEIGAQQLRRSISELGLKAVMLASTQNKEYLGDSSFDPYFAVAEELDVPVIIHPPVQPVEAQFVNRKNISTFSGFLNDQRTSLLDLCLSGVYEKYPRLKIIATHLGGGILTSLGRFESLSQRFPAECWYLDKEGEKQKLPHPIDFYIKKIYFDCNNADLSDVLHAMSKVGEDHLLTGTDFPWLDERFTREVLGEIGASIAPGIAYSNAAKLFGYEVRHKIGG